MLEFGPGAPEDDKPMALFDPKELVGTTFEMPDCDGNMQVVTMVKAMEDHQKCIFDSSQHMKLRTSQNSNQCEETLSHNKVTDHIKQQTEKPFHWGLCHTVSHQGPLQWNHPNHKGSLHNVQVLTE